MPWWIVPLVIVAIVIIAWLVMAGLPFGGDDDRPIAERPATETIAEGPPPAAPPAGSATIVDVGVVADTAEPPPALTDTGVTQTTAPPARVVVPPTATTAPPATVTVPPPAARPAPPAKRPAPEPEPEPEPAREISEDEAANVLRGYITSRRYYEVGPECVSLRGSGYQNVGYGFSVWDSCASGGGSRMLGRWRVDAKTREVFVQRDDGRYLRP